MPFFMNIGRGQGEAKPLLPHLFKSKLESSSRAGESKRQKAKMKWVERLRFRKSSKQDYGSSGQTRHTQSSGDDDSYLSSDPSSRGTLKLKATPDFSSSITETFRERGFFDSLSSHATFARPDAPVELTFVSTQPLRGTQASVAHQQSASNDSSSLYIETAHVVPEVSSSILCEVPQVAVDPGRPSSGIHQERSSGIGSPLSGPEAVANDEDSASIALFELKADNVESPTGQHVIHGEPPGEPSEEITNGMTDSDQFAVDALDSDSEQHTKEPTNISGPLEVEISDQIKKQSDPKKQATGQADSKETPENARLENANDATAELVKNAITSSTEASEDDSHHINQHEATTATTATTNANENSIWMSNLKIPPSLLHTLSEFRIWDKRMQWSVKRCEYLEELHKKFEMVLRACNERLVQNRDNAKSRVIASRIEKLKDAMQDINKEYVTAESTRGKFMKNCAERARLTLDILDEIIAAQGNTARFPPLDDPLLKMDTRKPPVGIDLTLLDPNHHRMIIPTNGARKSKPYQAPRRNAQVFNDPNDPTMNLQAIWQHDLAQENAKTKLLMARDQHQAARDTHDAFQSDYGEMLYRYNNGAAPVEFQVLSKPGFDGRMIAEQVKEIRELIRAEDDLQVAVAEARDVGVHCDSWDGSTCSSHAQAATNGSLEEDEEDARKKVSDSYRLDFILKWREEVPLGEKPTEVGPIPDTRPVVLLELKTAVEPPRNPVATQNDDDEDKASSVRTVRTWESLCNKAHGYKKVLLESWGQAQKMAQPFCDPWAARGGRELASAGEYDYMKRKLVRADVVLDFCAIRQKPHNVWRLNKT